MLFGQRRLLRRIAAHMLLVWLFALATGVANACAVDVLAKAASGPAAAAAAEVASVAADAQGHRQEHRHPHHHGLVGDDGGGIGAPEAPRDASGDAGLTSCAKFCADESSGTAGSAAAIKLPTDPVTAAWFLLLPPAEPVLHAAPAASVRRAATERVSAGTRVPIPIAFLRLTR